MLIQSCDDVSRMILELIPMNAHVCNIETAGRNLPQL
jgi:hypothetical protein